MASCHTSLLPSHREENGKFSEVPFIDTDVPRCSSVEDFSSGSSNENKSTERVAFTTESSSSRSESRSPPSRAKGSNDQARSEMLKESRDELFQLIQSPLTQETAVMITPCKKRPERIESLPYEMSPDVPNDNSVDEDKKNAKTEIVRKTRFADNLPQKKKKNRTFSFLKSVRSRQSSQSNILCRNHSVQISSIRGGTDRLDSLDKAKYVIPRVEYGSRLIKKKGGDSNVSIMESSKLKLYQRYFSDLFTTLIDMPISVVLLLTLTVYVSHWVLFGLVYWGFAHYNNDIPDKNNSCVSNVYDFTTSFLFSMESETTIGYGYRGINTVCPHAIVTLSLQCIISAIFDTWIIGIVYQRFARPDARTKTTLFSKQAVITRRDGKRCLIVRVANLRKSLLVATSIRARLLSFRHAFTEEKDVGYQVMSEQREVEFHNGDTLFFTAPVEYYHVIDKDSPLYKVRPNHYGQDSKAYFELVVTFTGTLEATGMTMQAQTSYLNTDILFGKRFSPVVKKDVQRSKYMVDFKNMDRVVDEPPQLYGDQTAKANGRPAWSVHTTLREEDENEASPLIEAKSEKEKHSKKTDKNERVRHRTSTDTASDDVFIIDDPTVEESPV